MFKSSPRGDTCMCRFTEESRCMTQLVRWVLLRLLREVDCLGEEQVNDNDR